MSEIPRGKLAEFSIPEIDNSHVDAAPRALVHPVGIGTGTKRRTIWGKQKNVPERQSKGDDNDD